MGETKRRAKYTLEYKLEAVRWSTVDRRFP
jgi:hypothetical protein